jgi:hypothetical protein
MKVTLTKIGNKYGCRIRGLSGMKIGKEDKALIEININQSTQDRIYFGIPKHTNIYL